LSILVSEATKDPTGMTAHLDRESSLRSLDASVHDLSVNRSRDHVAVLDGVRGIAILLVMLLHVTRGIAPQDALSGRFLSACDWGWCGVDLFFVLSGFLITGILVDTKGSPHFFRNFWARRVLRIFPLYYAYLIVFFGLVARFVPIEPERMAEARSYQLWLWLYGTNILVVLRGDGLIASLYFFWSLAVEEQFYVVWPLVVRWVDRRRMAWVCVAFIVVAIVSRALLVGVPFAPDVLTICRMDSLAVGALLAVMMREGGLNRWRGVARVLLGGLVGSLALATWWGADVKARATFEVAVYAVLAFTFGALLLLALTSGPETGLRRVLEGRSLRFFGRYAYGLYVFNQPVCIVLRHALPFARLVGVAGGYYEALAAQMALGFAGTIGAAVASYHLYEKHFLRLKRGFA
jgi:peptidoglycan/LPS O-acetylase OafA/YrhL